ncbi:MAG: hypothetical protein HPY50_12800 [Firmicutes bacterium]|nr:hypothetical protein [Bacillota bacterium]
MKTLMLVSIIFVCLLSWGSVFFLRQRLHPLEIFACYLFYTTLLQQSFTILTLNLHLFEMTDGVAVMIPIKLMGLSFYPIVNLWLLSFLGSRRIRLRYKFLLVIPFQLLLVGADFFHGWAGYIKVNHWSIIHGEVRHLVLLSLALLFMAGYRNLLRKERITA